MAVAVVSGRLLGFLVQMHVHLGIENPLGERLLQLIEQPVGFEYLRWVLSFQELVEQLWLDSGFVGHTVALLWNASYSSQTQKS